MEKNPTYYDELITRYLAGEATPMEVSELSQWVRSDPANRELFEGYRKSWQLINKHKAEEWIDTDAGWKEMEKRIHPEEQGKAGTEEPVIRPISTARQSLQWMARIAAIIVIAAVPLYFIYSYLSKPEIETLTVTDNITEVMLPDGTYVTVNRNSTLEYPSEFPGKIREVNLRGEAHFKVAHNPDKPFIIASDGLRIKVLGTSFIVNTHNPEGNSEVVLVDGSLTLYYADEPQDFAKLIPGEKAVASPEGKTITVTRNENKNFMAWKTKLIIFLDDPLDKVVGVLNNVYGTIIVIENDNLTDCRLTATFENQSLESVLKVLEATLDLQVKHSPPEIVLSGNGCN